MRLGAVYNQIFISPLMFDNKKVNNNNNYNGNNGDNDNNDNNNSDNDNDSYEIINTPANFVMTLDDSGETISGTYNAGNFRILTPSRFEGMIYGEIKETNTKFILDYDNIVAYGQNFSNNDYSVTDRHPLYPLSNNNELYVFVKHDPTFMIGFENYVIWAYITKLELNELRDSKSLQTVLLNNYSGDVFSDRYFGYAPNLTTVTLSDNKPYSENSIAFKDCPNIKDVRIILSEKDTPNTKNIEIIKNSFPSPKPTFTLYNPL